MLHRGARVERSYYRQKGNLCIGWWIILKWILKKWNMKVQTRQLVQERVQWWTSVNMVMVPYMQKTF